MSRFWLGSWSLCDRVRRTLGLLALLAGILLLVPSLGMAQDQPVHPDFPPNFTISNAKIVTGPGQVIEKGSVVVRNGLIDAVGAAVRAPADTWVIDGSGLTIYPGLIDAFTTIGQADPNAGRRSSASLPHSWGPEDRPGTFTWHSAAVEFDPTDSRISEWRAAGFTSALSTRPRGLITGEAAIINLAGDRARDHVVEPGIAQRINLSRAGNGYTGFPASLMGITSYLRQLHLDASYYDQVWTAYSRDPRGRVRPEYDQALEPLRKPRRLLMPATDRTEIRRVLRLGEELGAPLIIYGAQAGYDAADVLASSGTPVLVGLDWSEAPRQRSAYTRASLATLREWEYSVTTAARLQEAGVPFAFYSGSISDPRELRGRIRDAIDAGLDPDAALRALTIGPAEIFGVGDRLGTIEVGKVANLIMTDGDLFDLETKIERVIIDGRHFDLGQRGRTRRVASRRPAESTGEGSPGSGTGPVAPLAQDRGPYHDDPVTLIRNATIMTATGPAIEGSDLLIRDGKIAEIGKGLKVPNNARVVDATGLYLIPGIIDAHTHITRSRLINEGTVSVSAMVRISDTINPNDIAIYRALAGGVTTMNLLHGSSNPIGGGNAIMKLRWGGDADDLIFEGAPRGIKFALGENPKRTRTPARYPNSRMGVQDVIRQAFIDARDYMSKWERYEATRKVDAAATQPRRDLKLETLAEILRGERHVHAHSYRADEILQLIRVADEFGFRIQTLQHVLEGYKVADEIARHGAGASTFSDWWAFKVEAYDAIPHNAALMTERGVLVSINSDDAEEMRHLNQEAAKTMKWGGLSELEALRLVTLNPAIQLGIDERVGSIEVGKDADLVLYRGHPLTMGGVVQQTYIDGKLYFDRELDRQRQAEVRAEKEALSRKLREAGRSRSTAQADTRTGEEVQ